MSLFIYIIDIYFIYIWGGDCTRHYTAAALNSHWVRGESLGWLSTVKHGQWLLVVPIKYYWLCLSWSQSKYALNRFSQIFSRGLGKGFINFLVGLSAYSYLCVSFVYQFIIWWNIVIWFSKWAVLSVKLKHID